MGAQENGRVTLMQQEDVLEEVEIGDKDANDIAESL